MNFTDASNDLDATKKLLDGITDEYLKGEIKAKIDRLEKGIVTLAAAATTGKEKNMPVSEFVKLSPADQRRITLAASHQGGSDEGQGVTMEKFNEMPLADQKAFMKNGGKIQ